MKSIKSFSREAGSCLYLISCKSTLLRQPHFYFHLVFSVGAFRLWKDRAPPTPPRLSALTKWEQIGNTMLHRINNVQRKKTSKASWQIITATKTTAFQRNPTSTLEKGSLRVKLTNLLYKSVYFFYYFKDTLQSSFVKVFPVFFSF